MSETLYLKIEVDQKDAEKRTTKLTQSIAKLTAEKKKYTKALKDSAGADAKAAKELNKVNTRLTEQKKQLRLATNAQKQNANSLGGLNARNARLASIINKVNVSTATGRARFKALSTEMGKNQTRINQMNASMKRFQGNVGNYSGGIKSAFSQIGVAIAGVLIAFRTLDRLIGGSLKAFDQEVKAIAKVRQAIKSTNKAAQLDLKELEITATELQKNTIFGNEAILNNATAQLLTFTNIVGKNFLRTQEVALDVATVLDTTGDGTARLKDVSIQLGKALNDPVRNLSALSRAGIQFSEGQIKIIKELSNTNQLAEAQSLILDELEKQYGGQAKAAVVGLGAFQQLGNTIGDVSEGFGEFLSGALTPLAKGLNELLEPTKSVTDQYAELSLKVKDFDKNLVPLISEYEKLKEKTELSADEQARIRVIIGKIATEIPTAITKFDEYGNAIGISAEKAKEFVRIQREILKVKNKEAIEDQEFALKKLNTQMSVLETKILIGEMDDFGNFIKLSADAAEKATDRLTKMGNTKTGIEGLIKELSGLNIEIDKGGGDKGEKITDIQIAQIKKYNKIFKTNLSLETALTKSQKIQLSEKIIEIEKKTQEEIFALKKEYGLLTNKELADDEIKKVNNSLLLEKDKLIAIDVIKDKYNKIEVKRIKEKFSEIEAAEKAHKKALADAEKAMKVVFEMPEDFNVEDSPEVKQEKLTRDYIAKIKAETAKGRKKKLKEELGKNLISYKEYKYEVMKINIETAGEILSGISESLTVFGNLFEAQKQKELSAVGDNAEKREAIERKFAKKEQSIAAGKALISGAEVVLNAAKTQPYVPAGLIATILALGQTAAQIAVIKSQKFATGGVLTGQSHAQGGVPIEAEGGEVIINKRSASLFRDELSNINSYKGYGVAFAERGMLVPRQSSLPNYDAIISKTINAVSKIPVTLTEREITGIQNHVKVLENEGNL